MFFNHLNIKRKFVPEYKNYTLGVTIMLDVSKITELNWITVTHG